MKLFKYFFSFIIIIFTINIIFKLISNLELNPLNFLLENFYYVILTILIQILAIFIMSLRWKFCVKHFSDSSKLNFKYKDFLLLTSRGNILNNMLPSVLFGDISKLASPNNDKSLKKEEAKLIFFDRVTGLFTLMNLGIIAMFFIGLLSYYLIFMFTIVEFIFIVFFFTYQFRNLFIKNLLSKLKSLHFLIILVLSIITQKLFIFSLLIQVIGFKKVVIFSNDLFNSIFLTFVSMFPFTINGWGIREWSADYISLSNIDSEILVNSSLIYGMSFSISSTMIYLYLLIYKFIKK